MDKHKLTAKDSSLALAVGFFASQIMTILFLLIAIIVCVFAKIKLESLSNLTSNAFGYLATTLFFNAGILLTFFIFNRKKDNKIIKKPKISKIFIYLLLGIVACISLIPITNCFTLLLEKLNITITPIPFELDLKGYLVGIFSLVLLPAICEELLFRGLISNGLKPYGKAFTIIFTSLIFAIFHMSITQLVFQILLGLLLSVIMYNENNILYTIIVHAISNFTSITLSYLNIPLYFNHWTYILLAVLLLLVYLAIILYLTFKNNKTSEHIKMTKVEKIYFYVTLVIMLIFWIISNLIS